MYKSKNVIFDGVGVRNDKNFVFCEAEYPAGCVVTNPKILSMDMSDFTIETTPYGNVSPYRTGNEVDTVTNFHNENLVYLFKTGCIRGGILEGTYAIVKHKGKAWLVNTASKEYEVILRNSRKSGARLSAGKTYKVSFSKSFSQESIYLDGVDSRNFGLRFADSRKGFFKTNPKIQDYYNNLYEGEKILTYIGKCKDSSMQLRTDFNNSTYSYETKVFFDKKLSLKAYDMWDDLNMVVFYDQINDVYIHAPRKVFSLESEVGSPRKVSFKEATFDILTRILKFAESYAFGECENDKDKFLDELDNFINFLWLKVPVSYGTEDFFKLLIEDNLKKIVQEAMSESLEILKIQIDKQKDLI